MCFKSKQIYVSGLNRCKEYGCFALAPIAASKFSALFNICFNSIELFVKWRSLYGWNLM